MLRQLGFLGLSLFLSACYPAYDSYLQDVLLNFSESYFLTPDIFQVFCNTKREYPEDITDIRKRLRQACHKKLFYELFNYQVHYYLHWKNFLETGKGLGFGEYELELSEGEYETLEKEYQDFLPGQIVYEEWHEEQIRAVYRIEQKNLIKKIQARPLSVIPKIIKKS